MKTMRIHHLLTDVRSWSTFKHQRTNMKMCIKKINTYKCMKVANDVYNKHRQSCEYHIQNAVSILSPLRHHSSHLYMLYLFDPAASSCVRAASRSRIVDTTPSVSTSLTLFARRASVSGARAASVFPRTSNSNPVAFVVRTGSSHSHGFVPKIDSRFARLLPQSYGLTY